MNQKRNWIIQLVHETKRNYKRIYRERYGLCNTLTLAKAMEKAIEDDLCGLYNLVNNISITKYDLLHLFNQSL